MHFFVPDTAAVHTLHALGYAPGRAAWKARRLAELPLFLDTPRIAGVAASVFCYHQMPAFLDDLFHRRLRLCPVAGQGYLWLSEGAR